MHSHGYSDQLTSIISDQIENKFSFFTSLSLFSASNREKREKERIDGLGVKKYIYILSSNASLIGFCILHRNVINIVTCRWRPPSNSSIQCITVGVPSVCLSVNPSLDMRCPRPENPDSGRTTQGGFLCVFRTWLCPLGQRVLRMNECPRIDSLVDNTNIKQCIYLCF